MNFSNATTAALTDLLELHLRLALAGVAGAQGIADAIGAELAARMAAAT